MKQDVHLPVDVIQAKGLGDYVILFFIFTGLCNTFSALVQNNLMVVRSDKNIFPLLLL